MKGQMKGFVLGVVVCCVVVSSVAVAAGNTEFRTLTAAFCGITVDIDQRQFIPKDATGKEVEPFAIDGTTYLPIRAIAEALGKEVVWDDAYKKIIIYTKSEPVTEAEVERAFEEDYLKSDTISRATMSDGRKTPPNSETLEDYKVVSVERVSEAHNPNVWYIVFDVRPKHNPDADSDPMKGPYLYGWVAGNGEMDGDWVRGKSLFVYIVKTDGVVRLEVLGTDL